jgi:hypothetical protein
MWGTEWKPECGWQLHVNVSLGIRYSFILFFSSPSSRPELSPTTSIRLLLALWSMETIRIRAVALGAPCRLSPYCRFGVFGFQGCFPTTSSDRSNGFATALSPLSQRHGSDFLLRVLTFVQAKEEGAEFPEKRPTTST